MYKFFTKYLDFFLTDFVESPFWFKIIVLFFTVFLIIAIVRSFSCFISLNSESTDSSD